MGLEGGKKTGDNSQEANEVPIACGHSQDAAVFSPKQFGDLAAWLGDLDAISCYLLPVWQLNKSDCALSSNRNLTQLLVYYNRLNCEAADTCTGDLLAQGIWFGADHANGAASETNDQCVVTEPREHYRFPIVGREIEHKVFLSLRLQVKNLLAAYKRSDSFLGLCRIFVGTPLNLEQVGLSDERLVHRVTLVVRNSQKSILWPSYQVALCVPVTHRDFLAMLADTGDLTACLSVKENHAALVTANSKHRVGWGPRNETCLVFGACKLDVLEFALAHGPDWDSVWRCEDSDGVVVLVPAQVVDPGVLVWWKL